MIPQLRPSDDIRNLFQKKTYGMQSERLGSQQSMTQPTVQEKKNYEALKKKRKKIFEFEGRYDDIPDDNNIFLLLNGGGKNGKGRLGAGRRANALMKER